MSHIHADTLVASPPWTVSPVAPTVGEYLAGWLAGRSSLRPSTRAAYEIHVRLHLIPLLGDIPLHALRVEHVEAAYRLLILGQPPATGPTGPATLRRIHATLSSALNTAVRRGLIPANPARLVDLPRPPYPASRVWTPAQLSAFLTLTHTDRWDVLWQLLAYTGMRRGEALGLRWADLDVVAGTVRVEQQLVAVGGHVHLGAPKSARGRRTLHLPERLTTALARHRTQALAAGLPAGGSDLVFTDNDGYRLSPGTVTRHFDDLVSRTGLPRIRLHDLRHTSATIGLASGESLLEVSRRLGHSSIAITADVYGHLLPASTRTAADRLEHLIHTDTPGWPA